jgi:signal transduction histidine kinase
VTQSDEWLATLSHELSSPLATILDALDVAFSDLQKPGAKRAGEIAQHQARKALKIIEDLFNLNAHSCGKLALHKESVNIADVVARAIETASHLFIEHKHSLTISLPSEPVVLVADPLRLEQVLTNLLINAAKFTDPGGLIQVAVMRVFGEIVLRVRDNGRGMAAELLPKVFDLHVQGTDPGSRYASGLGLGLALVKSLVALHGGHVSATSSGPGTGSEFIVCLPT